MLEDPGLTGLSIDESTALLVNGRTAEVVGDWQVVVVKSPDAGTVRTQDGKFGARSVTLDIYLPGQTFQIDRAAEYVNG